MRIDYQIEIPVHEATINDEAALEGLFLHELEHFVDRALGQGQVITAVIPSHRAVHFRTMHIRDLAAAAAALSKGRRTDGEETPDAACPPSRVYRCEKCRDQVQVVLTKEWPCPTGCGFMIGGPVIKHQIKSKE